MAAYELRSLQLPRLTGNSLRAFTTAVENPAGRALLLDSLLENGGIPKFRKRTLSEPPTFYPLAHVYPRCEYDPPVVESAPPPEGFPYRTAADYAQAYRTGAVSPPDVAEKILAAIADSQQGSDPLRAFIAFDPADVLAQARAAWQRIQAGQPLSPLDGVPVAVKDELDMLPYPTTVGTAFLGSQPATQDSTVAARLRSAGALLVGKTNMHEIGINPNSYNAHFGTVTNPFNTGCDAGGSSSGSAAAVSAGLVPIAIGADGGGSIRIPAAHCGVVGLKPTFGRVSEFGAAPLAWSVAHLGPIAASVADLALAYSLIAGPDPLDPNSLVQPPPDLAGWNQPGLTGLRLGVYPAWFQHAAPGVLQPCNAMLDILKSAGAQIVEIEIPELDEMRVAHIISILSEMAVNMKNHRQQRKLHCQSTRLNLVLGEVLSAQDYLMAQRMRTRALAIFEQVFARVHAVLTPTTALAAQPFLVGAESCGWSDLGTETEMMRFVFPANLTGHPAASFPAGYDERGMPVGMQAIAPHWQEALLLKIAYAAEQHFNRRLPARHYSILD